jgi:hypothetical protein
MKDTKKKILTAMGKEPWFGSVGLGQNKVVLSVKVEGLMLALDILQKLGIGDDQVEIKIVEDTKAL